MTPRYREMILGDELTPVSKLSGAFLDPKSEMHLQFAYYESSLVVEFLVQKYGIDKLKAVLRDLGDGIEINEALGKELTDLNKAKETTAPDKVEKQNSNDSTNSEAIAESTGPLEQFDKEFAAFAHDRAEKLAPTLDFEQPDFAKTDSRRGSGGRSRRNIPVLRPASGDTNSTRAIPGLPPWPQSTTNSVQSISPQPELSPEEQWQAWAKNHPTNFWVLTRKANDLVEEKKWAEAKPVLQQLVEAYPDSVGPESAYRMLATAHREVGETNLEREVLERFAAKDDEAQDAYGRLMELGVGAKDWHSVQTNALRYLAVNPLVPPP
jgi:hypothetical protein